LKNKEAIDIDDIIENDDQFHLTKTSLNDKSLSNNNSKVDIESKFNLKKQTEEFFCVEKCNWTLE